MKAMQELFVKRNSAAIEQYWTEPYIQHNPNMTNGLEGIKAALPYLPEKFVYQPGIVVAEGNIVVAHSRVEGWGDVPQIIVDIFRLEDGKIIEHWDVIQPEITAGESLNGNPMTSFHVSRYNMNSISLQGNKFIAKVAPLNIELVFGTDNTLTFTVTHGAGLVPDGHTETLVVMPYEIRRNVFFLGWTERSGATVTHLEDYNREILYTHITMPDQSFLVLEGEIKPLTTPSVFSGNIDVDAKLNGKIIEQEYDDFRISVSFIAEGKAELIPQSGTILGADTQIVDVAVTPVGADCFLLSWQDKSKITVVQILDFATGECLCNITFPNQPLLLRRGRLSY